MEIKKWTLMFEGRPARAKPVKVEGGWDMELEGFEGKPQLSEPQESEEKAMKLILIGYERSCWDIY